MENKNLKLIQKICMVLRIINKIAFICCIVGVITCAISAIVLEFVPMDIVVGDGRTIEEIILEDGGLSTSSIFAYMVIYAILCAGEAVVSKFAENYFTHEIKDGTPFTYHGSKEMFSLAIINIAIPLLASIVAVSILAIIKSSYPNVEEIEINGFESLPISICLVFFSIIFKYGADLENKKEA